MIKEKNRFKSMQFSTKNNLIETLKVINEKPELTKINQDLSIIWKDQEDLVSKINQITKIN